jgi:hypothetical protein
VFYWPSFMPFLILLILMVMVLVPWRVMVLQRVEKGDLPCGPILLGCGFASG